MTQTIFGSPLVMLFIVLGIVLYPLWRILRRTGHSGWWSLLVFIPLVNLCSLWLLAFVRWPAIEKRQ
jgi:hypothetical protein